MTTAFTIIGIFLYAFIGLAIVSADGLTYGRLWPEIPVFLLFLLWPVVILYEGMRNWNEIFGKKK